MPFVQVHEQFGLSAGGSVHVNEGVAPTVTCQLCLVLPQFDLLAILALVRIPAEV